MFSMDVSSVLYCILAVFTCAFCQQQSKTEIKIGTLFSDEAFDIAGKIAFRLAVDYVNQHDDVLPHVTLTYATNTSSLSSPFRKITEACEVVQEGIVAVIGPATTTDVKVVSPILSALHIPQVAPFATDPTLSVHAEEHPYLFKMSVPDTYQSSAIHDMIHKFGWTRFAIISSATDYGRNGLTTLQTEALKSDWTITAVSYFYPSQNLTGEMVRPVLMGVRNKGTRIVVLNCLAKYARVVLDEAFSLGMLSRGWSWITTDGVTALELYDTCAQPPAHLYGVLGTRPSASGGAIYNYFTAEWADKSETLRNEVITCSPNIPGSEQSPGTDASVTGCPQCEEGFKATLYAISVFDSVLMTAYGIHDYLADGHELHAPSYGNEVCVNGDVTPWPQGQLLSEYMSKASGDGVAHYLNFTDLHYPGIMNYDVVNLRKKGWIEVGSWTHNGTTGQLVLDEPVTFPGSTVVRPEDKRLDLRNTSIRVVTIIEPPYIMINEEPDDSSELYSGYCIDLLEQLSSSLGFKYELSLVPDGNFGGKDLQTGEWNGMVGELIKGNADLVVAPLSITYEREQVIDFTKPYQDLGNIIVMTKEASLKSFLTFLDPFSETLWIAVGVGFLVCGFASTLISWVSPYGNRGLYSSRRDPTKDKYKDDRNMFNLWNSLWYSFCVWAGQGAEAVPRCFSGRLVYGAWYFATMIISATYTANLAAFLTVQKMDQGISSLQDLANQKDINYGTVKNTAIEQFFRNQITEPYLTMSAHMDEQDSNVDSSVIGFQKVNNSYGQPKGEQYAFIYDSAPAEYAASQLPCYFQTVGRIFNQFGYGLAVQKDSPYLEMLSLEILKLRQSGYFSTLKSKWVTSGGCSASSEDSGGAAEQATLEQMAGVFLLTGGFWVLALVILLFEYCKAANKDAAVFSTPTLSVSCCGAFGRRCRSINSDVHENFCLCIGCQNKDSLGDDPKTDEEETNEKPPQNHVTDGGVYNNNGRVRSREKIYEDGWRGTVPVHNVIRVANPAYVQRVPEPRQRPRVYYLRNGRLE